MKTRPAKKMLAPGTAESEILATIDDLVKLNTLGDGSITRYKNINAVADALVNLNKDLSKNTILSLLNPADPRFSQRLRNAILPLLPDGYNGRAGNWRGFRRSIVIMTAKEIAANPVVYCNQDSFIIELIMRIEIACARAHDPTRDRITREYIRQMFNPNSSRFEPELGKILSKSFPDGYLEEDEEGKKAIWQAARAGERAASGQAAVERAS